MEERLIVCEDEEQTITVCEKCGAEIEVDADKLDKSAWRHVCDNCQIS